MDPPVMLSEKNLMSVPMGPAQPGPCPPLLPHLPHVPLIHDAPATACLFLLFRHASAFPVPLCLLPRLLPLSPFSSPPPPHLDLSSNGTPSEGLSHLK